MKLRDAEHLLPDSIHEMIDIIGLPATEKVVSVLGGMSIKFTQRGAALHPVLESYCNELDAEILQKLANYFCGCTIYIPRCEAALRYVRNQRFVNDIATLVEEGLPITVAIMQLCIKYKISDRTAWKIISKKHTDNIQESLF